VICPACGAGNVPGEAFCDFCGSPLEAPAPAVEEAETVPVARTAAETAEDEEATTDVPEKLLCPACGAEALPGEAFCADCGASLAESPIPPEPVAEVEVEVEADAEPEAAEAPPEPAPVQEQAPVVEAAPMPPEPAPVVEQEPVAEAAPAPVPAAVPPVAAPACPSCGVEIEAGDRFCSNCGASLEAAAAPAPVEAAAPAPAPPPAPSPRLLVTASGAEIPLPTASEILVGREDPVSGIYPEVDLTPHGGDEGGVSRRHARITLDGGDYYIEDLNSTNFTFVNQQKLAPNTRQAIKDGDEIRCGRVVLVLKI
jgi:hypothetical protein